MKKWRELELHICFWKYFIKFRDLYIYYIYIYIYIYLGIKKSKSARSPFCNYSFLYVEGS